MLNFWDLTIYVLGRIPTADLAVGNYIKETASEWTSWPGASVMWWAAFHLQVTGSNPTVANGGWTASGILGKIIC